MSSPVQCLASEIAGLPQDHQVRLKTPKGKGEGKGYTAISASEGSWAIA